jgi:hypothetical protein
MTEEFVSEDHNCLKELGNMWKEDDPNFVAAEFVLVNIKTIGAKHNIRKTGQSVILHEKYTQKNGKVIVRKTKTFVSHVYCPFCGKRYP